MRRPRVGGPRASRFRARQRAERSACRPESRARRRPKQPQVEPRSRPAPYVPSGAGTTSGEGIAMTWRAGQPRVLVGPMGARMATRDQGDRRERRHRTRASRDGACLERCKSRAGGDGRRLRSVTDHYAYKRSARELHDMRESVVGYRPDGGSRGARAHKTRKGGLAVLRAAAIWGYFRDRWRRAHRPLQRPRPR